MTMQAGRSGMPQMDSVSRPHAGIPDWAGFLITVAILAYWLPHWVLLVLLAGTALWAAGKAARSQRVPWIFRSPVNPLLAVLAGAGFLAVLRIPPAGILSAGILATIGIVAWVIHRAGWEGYRVQVVSLFTSKWARAGGWLFVFLGKLIGYVVALGLGGAASAAACEDAKTSPGNKGPYYIKRAEIDDQLGWIDSHGKPEWMQ